MNKPYSFTIKGRICGEPLKLTKVSISKKFRYMRRKKFKDYMLDGMIAKSVILLLCFCRSSHKRRVLMLINHEGMGGQ